MSVKELIEELQKLPPDLPVVIDVEGPSGPYFAELSFAECKKVPKSRVHLSTVSEMVKLS